MATQTQTYAHPRIDLTGVRIMGAPSRKPDQYAKLAERRAQRNKLGLTPLMA